MTGGYVMGRYRVVLSVTLDVDAGSVNEAEDEAWDYWDTVCPDLECVSVTELDDQ
jgi:hypothetical protein